MRGGEDKVSVANTLPWSCIPNPTMGSAVSTTSVVSVWTTCPAKPTVLEAKDTIKQSRPGVKRFVHTRTAEISLLFEKIDLYNKPSQQNSPLKFNLG